MARFTEISDRFRAAADIEEVTPITVGSTTVGPDGRLYTQQIVSARNGSDWAEKFPLKDMRRLRFSVPTGTSNADALLRFFKVSTPEHWQSAWQPASIAARQSNVFDARWEAVAAWVREAEIVASDIPVADYHEEGLRSSLNELRQLTRDRVQVGLDKAQLICARAGVALVLVPELPGTRLSGCARWLNGSHALVGLTTRYRKDDQLWFTFFHEIGHILLHRERLSFVIDNPADHLGDSEVDPNMIRFENEADSFASATLIPPTALGGFLRSHGKTLTNDEIHDFAESIGVGPGIVVGRLQRDGILQWHQGNALKQSVDWGFASED